jgi:hypothetical protein
MDFRREQSLFFNRWSGSWNGSRMDQFSARSEFLVKCIGSQCAGRIIDWLCAGVQDGKTQVLRCGWIPIAVVSRNEMGSSKWNRAVSDEFNRAQLKEGGSSLR